MRRGLPNSEILKSGNIALSTVALELAETETGAVPVKITAMRRFIKEKAIIKTFLKGNGRAQRGTFYKAFL